MKNLHSGQTVKVFYDQKFFGQRHADRILVLKPGPAADEATEGLKALSPAAGAPRRTLQRDLRAPAP